MDFLGRLAARVSAPRRTVRLRLTALYGSLFLLSGAGLLALNYVLVENATQGAVSYQGSNGLGGSVDMPNDGAPIGPGDGGQPELTPLQDQEQLELLRNRAVQQRDDNMRELLIQSGIALAVMAMVSVVLGWFIAGRILRRLRIVTSAAQEISATDLNRRLALPGPEDELKELGDTFDSLLARLESAFHAHRQFVSNASHELLTPLSRARVISQVAMADEAATVETLREAHHRVLAAGAEQQRLVDALLMLARGQAGLAVRESFDLGTLAEQVVADRSDEREGRGLTLHTRFGFAPTTGDPRLAERLIINLVDNALRYNRDGGLLEVVTGLEHGRSVVRVSNTGPEVPRTALDQLFEPFQRMESSRVNRATGHGLGLSIVKAVADAHGAVITAEPRPSGGMLITVAFPADEAARPIGLPASAQHAATM